jgi:hypothetical protein
MAIALPVVLPFMLLPVVVLLAAGPPACELPPAVPAAVCATASVPVKAKAAANTIVVIFMVVSSRFVSPEKKSSQAK